jgi:hypothetical protein
MSNLFNSLKRLLPSAPLLVGEVLTSSGGITTIELPGGAILTVRGSATVGTNVFVRDNVVEGPAPGLATEVIDV